MKRKTLTSAVLAGIISFASIASAQEAPYQTDCANGGNNAVAIFDAMYASGVPKDQNTAITAPNNATKLAYVEEILTHQGVDVDAYTTQEKACMFVDVVWSDLRARYQAARRAARQATVQDTIDTEVASDLDAFEGGSP